MGSTKLISIFSNSNLRKAAEQRVDVIRVQASANTATKITEFNRSRPSVVKATVLASLQPPARQ